MDTKTPVIFLGIETSCDETAMAIISCGTEKKILAERLYSQWSEHQPFGGVVPRIATQAHCLQLPLIADSLFAEYPAQNIDALAVTAGPGLIGGVMIGALFAKGLSLSLNKPIWPVNHLAAHGLVVRFWDEIPFPYALLLVSGGHCQLLRVNDAVTYQIVGQTLDDSVGECLDKVGRFLGLGYPAGCQIERLALLGDPFSISLPLPLAHSKDSNFSFSGLKTACILRIQKESILTDAFKADFCASFQRVIADHLCRSVERAFSSSQFNGINQLVVSGGVSANQYFLQRLRHAIPMHIVSAPPIAYCTDNAVMIAWAGYELYKHGILPNRHFPCLAKWPLTDLK